MTRFAAQQSSQQPGAEPGAGVSVLLLDTPENLGIDFLQMLQRQELKLAFERVNDKEALHAALRQGNWDILLVCDQVNVPGQDETLAFLKAHNCETGYVLLSKAELSIDALTRAYRKGIAAVVSAHNPEYSLEVFAREAERCRRNLQLNLLHQEKFDLKRHCMQLMSGTQEALAYLHDGIHVFGNEAYLKLLGYEKADDLLVLPFIDLVSTEMREKTKQRLLDFQHRARLQPDTKELEIPELFVNAIGQREGILQVAATFKPVIYEGENCVQVVFKFSSGDTAQTESGVAEGLGYPVFITHLDSLAGQARAAGKILGQVLHIRASGCEHYIASKGFGSLNGKLKALASELKAALGKDDLLIRFTETSFLALHKDGADAAAFSEALATLLGKFEKALNREIGSAPAATLIKFAFDAVTVDAQSPPAEQIVRGFLHSPSARQVPEAPRRPAELPVLTEVVKKTTEKPAVDLQRLNSAFVANRMKLLYETVISVGDIETEFHDICIGLPRDDGNEILSRAALGSSELAGKLDLWVLHNALAVIADLYNLGQEYPVLISLSGKSLTHGKLIETIRSELKALGLPAEMLVIDFSLQDINHDVAAAAAQLEKLKADGISLCISEVHDISELKDILKHVRVERIRLQRALVEAAGQSERGFAVLRHSVEKLHALKMKVFAGDVASNSELALCCKAGIDLVKGKCIQKGPQALDADSMAEALIT